MVSGKFLSVKDFCVLQGYKSELAATPLSSKTNELSYAQLAFFRTTVDGKLEPPVLLSLQDEEPLRV